MTVTKEKKLEEELKELKRAAKQALLCIKVVRMSGHIVAHSMLNSEDFDRVVKPLERISGWSEKNKKDKEEVDALAKRFEEGTKGKTLKEKRAWLVKISKMSS